MSLHAVAMARLRPLALYDPPMPVTQLPLLPRWGAIRRTPINSMRYVHVNRMFHLHARVHMHMYVDICMYASIYVSILMCLFVDVCISLCVLLLI